MSTEANAQIISVIGGARRAGRWLVPSKTKVMTFFGRATIDLREAQTTAEELAFDCMSAFASITFIVPEGAEIRPSGMAILASARSDVPVDAGGCHLPKIAIDAITLFGRFRIVTGEALEVDDEAEEQQAVAAFGADLADTAPAVEPFRPPVEPFRPPAIDDPAAHRRPDASEERSPLHDATVPDTPAGVSLDDRPQPLPDPEVSEADVVGDAVDDTPITDGPDVLTESDEVGADTDDTAEVEAVADDAAEVEAIGDADEADEAEAVTDSESDSVSV